MADLRELVILSPEALFGKGESPLQRALANGRMALRRLVIAGSRISPIRRLLVAIYDAHFWLVAGVAKRFAGTRAVYGGGGVTAGDLYVGISDIDIAIFGDWPERRQFTLLKIFGLLTVLSPLYDRGCMVNICTVEDLRRMAATDMLLGLMYERGRTQWRLFYGENTLATLPEIGPERFSGCVAMELRRWWNTMTSVTFGTGIMGRDAVFQNSVCFKVVAETLRAQRMLASGLDCSTRRELIEGERARSGVDGSTYVLMGQLLASARGGFLDRSHDFRPATMQWLLPRMEQFNAAARSAPSFMGGPAVRLEGAAEERLLAPETLAHCLRVVETAERAWGGLGAAFLLPTLTMMSPDSMALLLEPQAASLPSVAMFQTVCAEHLRTRDTLPQRLRLYLLQPHGAYLLDVGEGLDLFHLTFTPEATPDVFAALTVPGFALVGEARQLNRELRWTPFAAEVAAEELHARRGAFARFGVSSRPRMIDNLRNFWRWLQLVVVEDTSSEDRVTLPITVAAIERMISSRRPELSGELQELARLFAEALAGSAGDNEEAASLMQRTYDKLSPITALPGTDPLDMRAAT